MTRDHVNNTLRNRDRAKGTVVITTDAALTTTSVAETTTAIATVSTPAESTAIESTAQAVNTRIKGGRPAKSTDKKKKGNELALVASKNEIASIFAAEKKLSGKKRLPRGRLSCIISEVKLRNNLHEDTVIMRSCIRSRLKKERTCVLQSHPGTPSPLLAYEMEFVLVLIQMARMRESLSPTESMELINAVIRGTQAQRDLVTWKKIHTYGDSYVLGVGY